MALEILSTLKKEDEIIIYVKESRFRYRVRIICADDKFIRVYDMIKGIQRIIAIDKIAEIEFVG